jgi:hypothetical protein
MQNKFKRYLNEDKVAPKYIHDIEVWMTHLGYNVKSEINGGEERYLRPCIILKRARFQQVIVVPLSTQEKKDYILLNFKYKENINYANILQIRTVDTVRLSYKIGTVSEKDFENVKEKIRKLLT